MKYLDAQLANYNKNIQLANEFVKKYPDVTRDPLAVFTNFDSPVMLVLDLSDAALAGKVFGKNDWTRVHRPYGGGVGKVSYDWTKTIDSVLVKISDAESHETMNNVPVPPSAFPLQIEDVPEVETADDLSF